MRADGLQELHGDVGGRSVSLFLDHGDRLRLTFPSKTFDLTQDIVSHRDDRGQIEFSVRSRDGTTVAASYRRSGPALRQRLTDRIDFMSDEPWTWEDGDFGLFVFNVAMGNGPMKYRHLFSASRSPHEPPGPGLTFDPATGTFIRERPRPVRLRIEDVTEVRVKFELTGIWASGAYLVLRSETDLLTWPIRNAEMNRELLAGLRELQGWDGNAEAAFEDAEEYESRQVRGPKAGEKSSSRAERALWSRS